MANEDNLIKFKKGVSGNPNGRPKKFTSLLKDYGYKQSEINDTIQNMLSMVMEDLLDLVKSDDTTILEKTIANALYRSYKKGSLYSIDNLLTRVYGKPKEQYDIQQDTRIEVVFVEGKTIL